MRFRMLSLVHRMNLIGCMLLAITNLCLVPVVPLYYVILQEVLAAALLVWTVFSDDPYITIDEWGIICKTRKTMLWGFQWPEIEELRRSRRFRQPSLEIVLKEQTVMKENRKSVSGKFFQLGKTAKRALKQYCKCPITK